MNDFDFYDIINKPAYAPSRKLFRPIWSSLYILMFISFGIFYFAPLSLTKIAALPLFCLQFILNLCWTPVFFRYRKIGVAFAICVVLLVSVILMTILFFKISTLLGILQIPYILWLTLATKLNWDVVRLN